MSKSWQLYDEAGEPIARKAADWKQIFSEGLLHAAAHVWLWWHRGQTVEVLVQKRAESKVTYPGMLDISAAGHVDEGETELQAAVRETREELGYSIKPEQLEFIFKLHRRQPAGLDQTENEWKFVYLCEVVGEPQFSVQADEVAALKWLKLEEFSKQLKAEPQAGKFVYQGPGYFEALLEALSAK